ncbi:MAG: type II toxin-antitoxin system VapB family antitoxin [Acidobacteriota bacterium]
MRTTVRLPDELMAQAKKVSAETNRTLTKVIEEALRESFARRQKAAKRQRVRLPTFSGSGLQPGVDLEDTASLIDLMEAADVSDRR